MVPVNTSARVQFVFGDPIQPLMPKQAPRMPALIHASLTLAIEPQHQSPSCDQSLPSDQSPSVVSWVEPRILQKLPCRRSVPWIQLHLSRDEVPVRPCEFIVFGHRERQPLLVLLDVDNCTRANCEAFCVRDLLETVIERPEAPDLLNKQPKSVMFIIEGNICWAKIGQLPPKVRLISCTGRYEISGRRATQLRTVAPRDHMSVGGPHLRFNCASGLLNIAALIT